MEYEDIERGLKKIKYGQKSIATFKGLIIEHTLILEGSIERAIMNFFKQHPQNDNSTFNKQSEHFFKHFLFIEQSFGFNSKLQALKTIMQIVDPKYFDQLQKKTPDIFTLIQFINDLRNMIAHNLTIHERKQIVGFKRAKKFKTFQDNFIDEQTGKTKVVDNPLFLPIIHSFPFTKKMQKEFFLQAKTATTFIYVYSETDYVLNKESVSKQGSIYHRSLLERTLSDPKVFNWDVGVFKLFDTNEKRKGKKNL